MELSYALNAVRRFPWVLAIVAVIVAAPLILLKGRPVGSYESTAILLVTPPSEADVPSAIADESYVRSQVLVLGSEQTSSAVSEQLGDISAAAVRAAVRVEQAPGSYVVSVIASAPEPERAREIAAAYVDAYFAQAGQQVRSSRDDQLSDLDSQLGAIKDELTGIDAQIQARISPFLPTGPIAAGQIYPPIPTPEQIAPDLASQRENLQAEYQQLATARTELQTSPRLRLTSQVVQDASTPDAPTTEVNKMVWAAAILGGLGIGVVACVAWARLSPYVLDDDERTELLGAPPLGLVPRQRDDPVAAAVSNTMSAASESFLDRLGARVESFGDSEHTLTVVVTGARRRVGVTRLSVALAAHFARSGLANCLIDADSDDPALTHLFPEYAVGIADVIDDPAVGHVAKKPGDDAGHQPVRYEPGAGGVAGLRLLGQLRPRDTAQLRRGNIEEVLKAASFLTDVIVADSGSLLDSAAAIHMARSASVVVFVVPRWRQRKRDLNLARQQLREVGIPVVPVISALRAK